MGDSRPEFHGMVNWNIEKRLIELTPVLDNKDDKYLVSFCPEGTPESLRDYMGRFVGFINDYGSMEQWELEDFSGFHARLLGAAIELWGYPVWSAVGTLSGDNTPME